MTSRRHGRGDSGGSHEAAKERKAGMRQRESVQPINTSTRKRRDGIRSAIARDEGSKVVSDVVSSDEPRMRRRTLYVLPPTTGRKASTEPKNAPRFVWGRNNRTSLLNVLGTTKALTQSTYVTDFQIVRLTLVSGQRAIPGNHLASYILQQHR